MKRNCPYCTSYDPRVLLVNRWTAPTKGSFHDGYDVVECGACGGVYADNIPNPEVINEYYSAQSKKAQGWKANDYADPDGHIFLHRATKKWVDENVDVQGKVLEIGCFTGHLMSMWSGEREICGYDPSRFGREVAKLKYGFDTDVANRFRDTRFFKNGDKFGFVILSHVVEHIADIEAFFEDIRPAIDDNGLLYIEVPDITNWFPAKYDPHYHTNDREPMLQLGAEHINYFSPSSLSRMMARLGFECVKCESRFDTLAVLSSVWKLRAKSNDAKYVARYINNCEAVFERHNAKMRDAVGPVYIWGAGGHTQRMMQWSEMGRHHIVAFIETNTDYHGGTLAGKPIISPEEIDDPRCPIIISSLMYQDAIVAQIESMGLKNQIITLYR
jgi:SAM-dependent methyltransferase